MSPLELSVDISELERLKQRFITRARALTLLRLALLVMTQVFVPHPIWALGILVNVLLAYRLAAHPRFGRVIVFISLILDLAWQAYAVSETGYFTSPLISALPAMTLLFAILFHTPLAILPPLLLLPVLTTLDPEVSIKILAFFSLMNACTIYLTNRILGEEETTSYRLLKLEVLEERQRLSRDIHDGVGSVLSSLVLEAQHAGSPELLDLAREALQETRYAISIMRDNLDLHLQMKHCIESFSRRHQVQTDVKLPEDLSAISNTKALSILHILQESLSNIGKHAKASRVEINTSLEQNQLFLTIKDNGVGFDPKNIPKNHYGIRNIEERVKQMGGWFHIQSQPQLGTHIQIGASL